MATAYAALISLMQIIDQIQHHPRPPISLDKQQVESLTAIITLLQEYLDGCNHVGYSKETDVALEKRIADVAHVVEDLMESHIVHQILADGEEVTDSIDFNRALQRVIDDMGSVKKEVMDAKEMGGNFYDQLHGDSSTYVDASSSVEQSRIVVGLDHILIEILDKLMATRGKSSPRIIISITGMGGIGKTTLVRSIFGSQHVAERFEFLALVTISQEYEIRQILLKILEGEGWNLSHLEEHELGLNLHQKLIGRKYLIIIDDIWNIDVWDRLKMFLPKNNNGSGILITTRLSMLGRLIENSHIIKMEFLDEDKSWELFFKHVFGKEDCPLELEEIGKKIVEGCKGLPLSISVVGGLLAKSRQRQQWEHIAENLNSTVNLEDNERCLHILYLSYNSLPNHLKPCFLYMGGFEKELPIWLVVALWVAEGFVKPIHGKSLEETAKDYLLELIDRNLLFIDDKNSNAAYWIFSRYIIHDLLRDLCIREAQKQAFFSIVSNRSPNIIDDISIRRVTIGESTAEEEVLQIMESAPFVRSLRCYKPSLPTMQCFPLLRVSLVNGINDVELIIRHVNLRVLFLEVSAHYKMPPSISRLWNLQALFIGADSSELVMAPLEIWMMPQLRCIMGDHFYLPETSSGVVLENLISIGIVYNFKCSEEAVERIPHVQFLMTCYTQVEEDTSTNYCLGNLGGLQELQILSVEITYPMQNLTINFPLSLKVLVLFGTTLLWDEVNEKIGSLPLLEYLRLDQHSCVGATWETIEGQFCCLKTLLIFGCSDLEQWMTESTHFPRLERLVLHGFYNLDEIPSCIGDISTLQSIEVKKCSESVYKSVERIKEEQEEFGNDDLQVVVIRSRIVEEEQHGNEE